MPRKFFKKRTFRKRRTGTVAKIVRRMLYKRAETKHYTKVASNWATIGDTLGTIIPLTTGIYQGTGDDQRVGNRITITKVNIVKLFRVQDNSSIPHATIRFLLVQSRGQTLSTSDMPAFGAPCDLDKMIVIKDRLMNLSSAGQNSTGTYFGGDTRKLAFSFRPPKSVMQYDDNTAICNNPLYLFMICDNDWGQQMGYESIYFKDM